MTCSIAICSHRYNLQVLLGGRRWGWLGQCPCTLGMPHNGFAPKATIHARRRGLQAARGTQIHRHLVEGRHRCHYRAEGRRRCRMERRGHIAGCRGGTATTVEQNRVEAASPCPTGWWVPPPNGGSKGATATLTRWRVPPLDGGEAEAAAARWGEAPPTLGGGKVPPLQMLYLGDVDGRRQNERNQT
jgi:hypothetical protein